MIAHARRRGAGPRWTASLLTLSLLGAPAAAQQAVDLAAARDAAAAQLVPIHTASPDQGCDYGVWGRGPGYKVSFHDGATVVPLLGRDYPHNQPWRWTTTSVMVGARELVTQAPQLGYRGLVAQYSLGEVVERYELQAGGVEQTFVLEQRVGEGDLVVRGAVATLLHATTGEAAHQPLHFVDEAGRHLLTYGAATAVDAGGRCQPMTTALVDGVITLRLDDAWLASASYPVVVDPLVGPGTHHIGEDRDAIDLCRDSETGVGGNWIGYSFFASLQDRDVELIRYDDDGFKGPVVFSDVTASWSSQGPSVGYVAGADRALMAFDRLFASGARQVRYHTHHRTDHTLQTNYGSVSTSNTMWRVDVGGTVQNAAGNVALLVWQDEGAGASWVETPSSTIRGCWVDAVAGVATPSFVVADGAFTDNERPRVNQHSAGAAQNSWLCAYQTISTLSFGGSVDDWDIGVRELAFGLPVSAPTWIDSGSLDHKFSPWIEGESGRYLVMFVASPNTGLPVPAGDNGHELRTVRLDWATHGGGGTQPNGTKSHGAFANPRLVPGGLGFDRETRSHWGMTYMSTVTQLIYMRVVGFTGSQVWHGAVVGGASQNLPGGVSFDASGPQMIAAFNTNDPGFEWLTIDRFVFPAVAAPVAVGGSCSAASIEWRDSQQIGSAFCGPRVSGAAFDSLHLMVVALQPASLQVFGLDPIQDGCWLLVPPNGPDHLGILDLQIGSQCDWTLPLPEYVASTTLYLQDFHTVGNGGPFELVSTQRLEVPIVK